MQNKICRRTLLALICVIISVPCAAAHAQTTGGFSIRAVIPDNQMDKRQTYFDLRMKPGEKQTLSVLINNSRNEDFEAEISLNAATTGRNGLVVYTEPHTLDDLMKISITDVAVLQAEKITIPAQSSGTAKIDIKMPDEPFDGTILGGIAVTGSEAEGEEQSQQGVSLKNRITYVIGLKLTENDIEIAPDFDIKAITPQLVNFRTAVVTTLQNKSPRIVKDLDIKAQVFREGSDTPLHELTRSGAEMAPLSSGDFVIDWENQPLNQGNYRLKMTADYGGEAWSWDKEFLIGGEAGDLNSGAVELTRNYTWLFVLLGVVLLTLVWLAAYRVGKHGKAT